MKYLVAKKCQSILATQLFVVDNWFVSSTMILKKRIKLEAVFKIYTTAVQFKNELARI